MRWTESVEMIQTIGVDVQECHQDWSVTQANFKLM